MNYYKKENLPFSAALSRFICKYSTAAVVPHMMIRDAIIKLTGLWNIGLSRKSNGVHWKGILNLVANASKGGP
ncbi:hypothetical protein SCA6_000600 [Theobroma cacao]